MAARVLRPLRLGKPADRRVGLRESLVVVRERVAREPRRRRVLAMEQRKRIGDVSEPVRTRRREVAAAASALDPVFQDVAELVVDRADSGLLGIGVRNANREAGLDGLAFRLL